MTRTAVAVAVVVALLGGCDTAAADTPPAADSTIAGLVVAAETTDVYDRAVFGDYDRDQVIAASGRRWRDCDGHYSPADNLCHPSADAVHVDHIVALSEAWDSGASEWTAVQLDEFAGDPANLWLMTSELNLGKTDGDAAEWLPPHDDAVCSYVAAYAAVKAEWGLTVDAVERDALADAAADCYGTETP